jgi:hypothetical protein
MRTLDDDDDDDDDQEYNLGNAIDDDDGRGDEGDDVFGGGVLADMPRTATLGRLDRVKGKRLLGFRHQYARGLGVRVRVRVRDAVLSHTCNWFKTSTCVIRTHASRAPLAYTFIFHIMYDVIFTHHKPYHTFPTLTMHSVTRLDDVTLTHHHRPYRPPKTYARQCIRPHPHHCV